MQKYLNLPILLLLVVIASVLGYKIYSVRPHYVTDCSVKSSSCEKRILDANIKNCKPWFLGNPGQPECEKTLEGLRDITYIADIANYVPVPFTKQRYKVENIESTFTFPWDISFLPDGSMLVTEVNGSIKHRKNNTFSTVYKLKPYTENGHLGLLGLAVDPDFNKNKYIYILYTDKLVDFEETRVSNKLVRLTFTNNKLENPTVLLDNIPGSFFHSGGRLKFGPDKKLYVTVGDAADLDDVQDKSAMAGKILRINTDGSIPNDNPLKDNYMYSYGHRNPQGLTWDTKNNLMYASEHGFFRHDEINNIIAGKNYGWPNYSCDTEHSNYPYLNINKIEVPIYCTKSWTSAPSGIEFVNDPNSPWNGSLFIAMLRGKQVHRLEIVDNKVTNEEIFYISQEIQKDNISQRIRDVEYYEGSLYVLGDGFGLIKISPNQQ